ncbi:hypothetical protein BaRGS_00007596 [Batillaria attramentaria]|uniref:Uncharacterized protein n=1 Tax=Batillaria attramentaria TaxID=370345 RepID=A0ABD0LPE5_9CAEN
MRPGTRALQTLHKATNAPYIYTHPNPGVTKLSGGNVCLEMRYSDCNLGLVRYRLCTRRPTRPTYISIYASKPRSHETVWWERLSRTEIRRMWSGIGALQSLCKTLTDKFAATGATEKERFYQTIMRSLSGVIFLIDQQDVQSGTMTSARKEEG